MSSLQQFEFVKPADIERRSFALIDEELERLGIELALENESVIKRVIHTTADFDYAHSLAFSKAAVQKGVDALKAGCSIVTDTSMAAAGINKRVLGKFGGQVHNFIADLDVAEEARDRGVTRSLVCMERAAKLDEPLVFAIGNAPTALIGLHELICKGQMTAPELIIGVPVGFVNVVESKELILNLGAPSIVARGRKGGSNVAAAICNALLYLASNDERE